MVNGMTIGQLARSAQVNVETIRYYQRIGLIEEPPKPPQGYRLYSNSLVERVQFIKRAQELGFTLTEVSDLLSLDDRDCSEARSMAEHKWQAIQDRIDDLAAMQQALTKLIATCRSNAAGRGQCAIIQALSQRDRPQR